TGTTYSRVGSTVAAAEGGLATASETVRLRDASSAFPEDVHVDGNPAALQVVVETGNESGRHEPPDDRALVVEPFLLELEDVLHHVQRFPAPALADDDAVGPHPQRIAHQVPDGDLPLAFDVRRPRLQLDPVLLRELQLGSVLDGDDPFLLRDASRQDIQ